MTAECCSTFLMTILGVFLVNQWNLAEGQFQIITINNGSLEISCKLRKLQNQHQSLISWQKDGEIIPKEHYVIQEGYANLSIINATLYDRGFYYLIFNKSRNDTCKRELGSTDTCSCKRDVKINVPDCRPNVVCSCIDLETMNCSFTDSICQFQNWKLKFKTLKTTKTNDCIKKNDNFILCRVNNNKYFTNNVSEWIIEAFNETSWAGVSFQFDSRKFVTFVNEPDLKVTKFPNSSVVLTSTMDRSRTSYYNNLYGSSDIIFKIVIKDQWESKEILTKKEYRFDTCPDTNYNVAVSYQKEDSPLYDIWSKSRTEIIKTGSEVPLPVPEITDGCFMNRYDDVYLIYWKKVKRCYKNADFAYLLKCGEQTLTSTKKHSFTIVDYHSRCNEHPIQIFSTTNSNISKESASISIPKKVLSMPSSSLDVFYKKLEDDTQYEISWKNKDFEISNYTIFYCKIMKDQNYFCDQSGIDWLMLNQKTLFFESDFSNYEKSKDNTYQLAISARNGSDNSGILWLNCIIPFEIEGDQSVEALQQAERGTTWMIIHWEFPCEKRSKQVEGFIIYWASEDGDSPTIHNSSTLDWHQEEYNITGLYKETNYSVSIGTKIKGQPNPHNVTQYFMTGSDGSSSTELWLIVILVAVIVISLTVIASYCIMKTWKIFKEKVDVTLPSGLTTTEQVQSPRNAGVLLENNIALILNNKDNNDERRLSVINAFNANENFNNNEELMMCVNPGDSPSLHSDMYVSLFESLQTNLGEYEGEWTLNSKHDSNTNSPEVTRENTPLTKGYVCFATGGEIGDQNRQQDEAKKKNGAYVQLSRLPIVTPTVEPSIQTNIHEYSYV